MEVKIREAVFEDFGRLEEILLQNDMLTSPEVEGYAVGMIRGCYDGSRAIIHQMAVDKTYQKRDVGKRMLYELASRFKGDGAPSISVTATKKSRKYYKNLSFSDLPITLMVSFDINKVIKKTKSSNFV